MKLFFSARVVFIRIVFSRDGGISKRHMVWSMLTMPEGSILCVFLAIIIVFHTRRRFPCAPLLCVLSKEYLSFQSRMRLRSTENSLAVLCTLVLFFLCHSTTNTLNFTVYELRRFGTEDMLNNNE